MHTRTCLPPLEFILLPLSLPPPPPPPPEKQTLRQVARALIEFETLWHQAWIRSIEQCKAGLAAPLMVQVGARGKQHARTRR